MVWFSGWRLTLLEPQSRSGDNPVKFQVVLSPNGTAVLKGLMKLLKFLAAVLGGVQGNHKAQCIVY